MRLAIEKPKITKPLKDIEITKSGELRLEIHAISETAPTFEWTKDGDELTESIEINVSNDGVTCTLTINPVDLKDRGLYSCKVSNENGSVESSARVEVKQPDVNIITSFPECMTADAGTDLILSCELSNEEAVVNWLRNGKPLIENEKIQFVEVGTTRQMIIKNVTEKDSADYTCSTEDGNSRARCKVTVKPPEAHVKLGPEDQIIKELGQTVVVEAELTCPAEGIKWLKDGCQIDIHSPKYSVSNEGLKYALKILDFNKDAIGEYSIQLPNGESSAPARLQLQIPAKLETASDELLAQDGKELSFTVHASGFPTPTFTGTLNEVPLKSLALIDTVDDENIKITIKPMRPEYAGKLKLKVANDFSEDTRTIPIKVLTAPQPPRDVQATLSDSNSAEIRWSPDEEDPSITEYVVERKVGDQTRWRQCGQVSGDGELLCIDKDLPPDELVMFRVSAVNEVGRGKPSKAVDVITKPKAEEETNEEISKIESALQERFEEENKPTAKWKNKGIELFWKIIENARLYAIERRSSKDGIWVQIACTDRNWFVDRNLPIPGCYTYRVVAQFDEGGTKDNKYSEPTDEICVEKENIEDAGGIKEEGERDGDKLNHAPEEDALDVLSPTAELRNKGIELKWKAIENVRLYAIERKKAGDRVWVKIGHSDTNSYVDKTIEEPGRYVYRYIF